MFKATIRGSEEDWWFKFQNEKPAPAAARLPPPGTQLEDQKKRTMVKRFLHSSVYKVKEKPEPPRHLTLNTLRISGASTTSTLKERSSDPSSSSQVTQISRSQFTKSLRSCASSARHSIFERPSFNTAQSRVVTLGGLAATTSVAATVALICGGPLEKIIFHETPSPSLEVHFLSGEGARKFVEYSRRNALLAVNGYPLRVTWAKSSPGYATGHTPLPSFIAEEVEAYHASRILVMSKIVGKKQPGNPVPKGYPNPRDNFSPELEIEKMKWDFVQFGGIVEVAPMVSSKLSVSVQFTDIRSAILATHSLEQRGSSMYARYKDWHVKYVRDITNKPCLSA